MASGWERVQAMWCWVWLSFGAPLKLGVEPLWTLAEMSRYSPDFDAPFVNSSRTDFELEEFSPLP